LNQTLSSSEEDTPQTGAELFELGNSEYDAGRYERALEMFDRAISSGLANEVVFNNKGTSLDAMGRFDEAINAYEEATRMNPSYELAWHNLGNSYFIQEMYDESARAYSRAARTNASRKENWSGLAASYARLGMAKKAKDAVGHLDVFVDQDPSVLLLQADLYVDSGHLELARDKCMQYLAKHADDVQGHMRLGNIYHELGEYNSAIFSYSRASKLDPENKELWNNMGYSSFAKGYLERALECFDKAIAIDPGYKQAWYNKGYAFHGADRLEEAVSCYRKAIELDPLDRVLWNNLGNALYNLGSYADSIPRFVEAIRVDPDYEIAWNNIGNALEKMGAFVEAIPYHDKSLEIDPTFDYALYAKGVCLSSIGELERGYDLILDSLDLNPNYDEAWRAKANVAMQLGRLDDSLSAVEQSLAVNPEFDEGWVLRGEILSATGDLQGSEASFRAALECLQDSDLSTTSALMAVLRRGDVLARLGKFEESNANYESVVLTGKLDFASVPRLIKVRRALGKWDLSEALRKSLEQTSDVSVRTELAEFLLDAGQIMYAERVLEETSKLQNAPPALLVKARARALKGDLDGAAKFLGYLPGDASREPATVKFEAELLESRGDLAGAESAYSKRVSMSPSDIHAVVSLARVQLRMGRYDAAIQNADLAIGIDRREWEPHKIKADAYSALGELEDSRSELARARAKLALMGMKLEDVSGSVSS